MNYSALEGKDFITKYLTYTSGTEVPTFFNRWACIVGLGAWATQDVWFPFGSGQLYPNLYAMLVGEPGSRKSTAIKDMKNLLKEAGYSYFAGEKTSKEKFLEDLACTDATGMEGLSGTAQVDQFLFGSLTASDYKATPVMIAADEFSDFFGNNVMDFISMLGVLWDFTGVYKNKVKNGASVEITNPNVSILGGNTVESLCSTFPTEALGQGFFSRLLFIYGEPNGTKIAFPRIRPAEDTEFMKEELLKVKKAMRGEMVASSEARKALEHIYLTFKGLPDSRFSYYSSRRFVQLIKLSMIHALSDYSSSIELVHVVRAHTVLVHTEHFMPRALGEFGRARNSAIVHRIMSILENSHKALDLADIWTQVQGDMDKISDLGDAIRGLSMSGKVQIVEGGFLACKEVRREREGKMYDWSYLTDEERGL